MSKTVSRSVLLVVMPLLWVCVSSAAEPNADPFPTTSTKKGLQMQMQDDAVALGVQHAALNVNLTALIDPTGDQNGPKWIVAGKEYAFSPVQVADIDARVRPLSSRGMAVYLILLTYVSGDETRDRLMLHPNYAGGQKDAGPIGMFNTGSPEGAGWLQACCEFLADRYSADRRHGRVWGYICGNEVDSHWYWANMGDASPEEVITEYERAVRLIHSAVRQSSAHGRVYISMDHFWKDRFAAGNERQCIGGRAFLDGFTAKVRANGDFDWHLAHHPYPEPLTDPRFWLDDKYSAQNEEAHSITFRNLDVLTRHLQLPELLIHGQPRRVILSEQGFHCDEKREEGELEQAAAYALAYKKVDRLPGIDAFILHRHVDHAHEGGLNLGLWTNASGEVCTPDRKRKMYDVFQAAGTPEEDRAFEFALPVIGSKDWEEALQKLIQ